MLLSDFMSAKDSVSAPLELAGQVALISGGGTGIGRAIAEALVSAGASVAISGRRSAPLEATVGALRAQGGTATPVSGDVASPADCQRMVEETVASLGGLRILINNAGIAEAGDLSEMTPEIVDSVIDIDLKGPIHLTRAALPHLAKARSRGGAAVVNVSSSVTRHPVPGYGVYSAAKAGLEMLTRSWARDLGDAQIRVNAVCPGVVRTPIHESRMEAEALQGFLDAVGGQTPLGRTGEAAEVAQLVRFLASPAAGWITGAVIPIDGGLSLT